MSGCEEHAANPQPSWCLECMETTPPPAKPRPRWSEDSRPFLAQFAGDCASCSGRFVPGVTMITRWVRGETPDAEFVYTHAWTCKP